MTPLPDLQLGSDGVLSRIESEDGQRRRLMEMGLVPGTTVRLIRRARVGDVIEVEGRGYRVALRLSEAKALLIESA
ncbi:MAG: FeoA family protein [Planctomycetota bacterium]